MTVELFQSTPNPVEFIARIASVCYDSDPKNPAKLVEHLYKNGHHSVFEHVYFTFRIDGISRACSHQLVRHRMCSFTQRSQRYCDESNTGYVCPGSIKEQTMSACVNTAKKAYSILQFYGASKEDARYVLPNACETELYLSCNLRELIHIANERLCNRAQWEIRDLVQKMVELVDPDLRWMLVPKCQSGFLICNNPCKEDK